MTALDAWDGICFVMVGLAVVEFLIVHLIHLKWGRRGPEEETSQSGMRVGKYF